LVAIQRQEHANLTSRLQQKDAAVNVLHTQMETLKAQLNESHTELQRVKSDNAVLLTKSQYAPRSHTHMFNGPFSGTTQVSRYQKGKTNLDYTEARDSE